MKKIFLISLLSVSVVSFGGGGTDIEQIAHFISSAYISADPNLTFKELDTNLREYLKGKNPFVLSDVLTLLRKMSDSITDADISKRSNEVRHIIDCMIPAMYQGHLFKGPP